jgi:hypothetical protein
MSGHILGDFFTNSSGHPVPRSLGTAGAGPNRLKKSINSLENGFLGYTVARFFLAEHTKMGTMYQMTKRHTK